MNRKNFLLTMLACLNCVHTTHAVESTPKTTQKVDRETMDKLRVLWAIQERRCTDFPTIDAVQKGDIAIAKDALLEGVRDIINCLPSLPETVLAKDDCIGVTKMLQDKTKELCETGKITDPIKEKEYEDLAFYVSTGRMPEVTAPIVQPKYTRAIHPPRPYTDLLRTPYPDLAQCFEVAYTLLPIKLDLTWLARAPMQGTNFDARIDGLRKKYPDIAKQIVDWEKMMWKTYLIRDIKNGDIGAYGQHLGEVIELLGASNSKIAQEAWNTTPNTIHHCMSGEDQDLKEKTKTLLEHDPALRQEIRKIKSRRDRMTLAKILKPKGNISDHLQKCVLKSVVKYV